MARPGDTLDFLERIRADQRSRWSRGDRVLVETYLQQYSIAADQEIAIDLVYGEFCLRESLGESPDPAEYLRRFPALGPDLQKQFAVHEALPGEAPRGFAMVDGLPRQSHTMVKAGNQASSPQSVDQRSDRDGQSKKVTVKQFVRSIAASGLLPMARVEEARAYLNASGTAPDVQRLAQELVNRRQLTVYQATTLYHGITKGLVLALQRTLLV